MKEKGTYIGVLTNHDDDAVNKNLVDLLNQLYVSDSVRLGHFHFLFTGGTYDRVVLGKNPNIKPINPRTEDFLINTCGVTRLPGYQDGGVTMLSYFITRGLCSIMWQFFSPKGYHWRRPEALAQIRLCDQWHVKRLMNKRSVEMWFTKEAGEDYKRNLQDVPPRLVLREGAKRGATIYRFAVDEARRFCFEIKEETEQGQNPLPIGDLVAHVREKGLPRSFEDMTIALIAHDEMKDQMISFAVDHEWELSKFGTILATGTTGREVLAATSRLHESMHRYHSGPKGGDIEIATEILLGRCHVVIFFIDPLNPHPHIDDIRTVFEACMIRDKVLMITNEMHAREFMTRVVRGNTGF
jgi:methylglyoxal synthase